MSAYIFIKKKDSIKMLQSHKLLRGTWAASATVDTPTDQGKDEAEEEVTPGALYPLTATSGWAPSLYFRLPLSSPLFSCLPPRPLESGESSPVGYPSCSTSTFISSQRPVLAAQEKIGEEKRQPKQGRAAPRGE